MEFSRIFLNHLQEHPSPQDTVVVIDVLRSFTTAAVALAGGARALYPVDGLAAANILLGQLEEAVSAGAIAGGDPMPGFDYGNSPAQLQAADLQGQAVVMSTAAGVRGLLRFRQARHLYAASLVVARATAAAIRAAGAEHVCFVITGDWIDRDGDEDIACADYLEGLLRDGDCDPAPFAERVRNSDFGRRFSAGTWPNLPRADLELAAEADRYDFAMRVRYEDGHLVIR